MPGEPKKDGRPDTAMLDTTTALDDADAEADTDGEADAFDGGVCLDDTFDDIEMLSSRGAACLLFISFSI
jgi:hypothetical protein